MKLPADPEGYAVLNGTVHTRYADHADGASRTRTAEGAEVLGAARTCDLCYPPPKPRTAKPRAKRTRR